MKAKESKMLRCLKPKPGKILTECLLHGTDKMVYCKAHPWMRRCSGCETACMFCQPVWEYRQVVTPKRREIEMSRTRPAR